MALLRIYQYQRLFGGAWLTDIGRHLHVPYQVFLTCSTVWSRPAMHATAILTLTPSGHRQVDSSQL